MRAGKCPGCGLVREDEREEGYGDGVGREWVCPDCEVPFCWLGVVGWREGALAKLVKDFKYKSVRAAGEVLVDFLDERIPKDFGFLDFGVGDASEVAMREGGLEVVVVPLPTIGRHVRERGLDHTAILARKLAKRRGWKYERVLGRATDVVQVGTKAVARKAQAEKTYEVVREASGEKLYLLVDDVWTTGATMLAAEKALKEAGAKWIAGVALATGRGEVDAS